MSAVETTCYGFPPEKESGAGERNCTTKQPMSHIVSTEIVHEILNNAFEVIASKELQQKPTKVEKITPNVVGDILESIIKRESYRHDETDLLNDEIKKIIKEMKYPEHGQGVGDQPISKSEQAFKEPSSKRNTLERKNRLTNLVRNSKHMLAKLVNNEEHEVRCVRSEEVHEKLIKVIDLEGNDHLEAGCSSTTGILRIPPETLEVVDLKRQVQDQGDKNPAKAQDSKKSICSSKKKWNLGARIMKYLRKNKSSNEK